ncbi:MAG: squalene synthase HpnC [Rhizobiales bacterium]|nr:squalene synthase HpnC [Hyphomicrobiales bacterium]
MIETPSGKGAGDENFPVGSFLLPKPLRPHVAVYYAFARAADDIADNPALEPRDKVDRLEAFDRAVTGQDDADDPALAKAHAVRRSFLQTGVHLDHARDLLSAFKQDAVKTRYNSWDDVIDYCNRSAAPVGRFLLELHGEDRAGFAWSDQLCNALQVLNHLQDCADDYNQMNRVYLPGDWMAENNVTVDDLKASQSSSGLRRVIDRCLEETDKLVNDAEKLPGNLTNRRLAMESAVIVRIARKLTTKLKRQDPVKMRVELSKPDFISCSLRGALAGLLR